MSIYTVEVCDICGKEWKEKGHCTATYGTFHTNFSRNIDVFLYRGKNGSFGLNPITAFVEGITDDGNNTEGQANELIECLEKSCCCDVSTLTEIKTSIKNYYKKNIKR